MAPFGLWILGMKWAGYVQGSRAATGSEMSGPFRSQVVVSARIRGYGLGWSALPWVGEIQPITLSSETIHQRFEGCRGPGYKPQKPRAAQKEQGLRDCTPCELNLRGKHVWHWVTTKGEHCTYNNKMRDQSPKKNTRVHWSNRRN